MQPEPLLPALPVYQEVGAQTPTSSPFWEALKGLGSTMVDPGLVLLIGSFAAIMIGRRRSR